MKTSATRVVANDLPKDVTGVLQICLPMSNDEQARYLDQLAEANPRLREEVDAVLKTGEHSLESNKVFLSALIDIASEDSPAAVYDESKTFEPFSIGKYLLLKELGRGGMAEVYRGKARGIKGFERQVAIKKITDDYSKDKQFRNMFEFEANLSASLHHPNVVQVFDFFGFERGLYLVMELVDGRNLSEVIQRLNENRLHLPLECCLLILCDVLKGLDYAHCAVDQNTGKALNIVHRDVSPKNIMVTFGGDIKIVDFGIAKARERLDITNTGTFRGTVSYMSPEVVLGADADRRSDIFAAGLLLYEMLTGEVLFKANTVLATMELVRKCEVIPRIESLGIDDELKTIVRKALEKDPNSRYQTAESFHSELQRYLHRKFPPVSHKKISFILRALFTQDMEQDKRDVKRAQRILDQLGDGVSTRETTPEAVKKSGSLEWILLVIAFLGIGAGAYIYFTQSKRVEEKTLVGGPAPGLAAKPVEPVTKPPILAPEEKPSKTFIEVLSVGRKGSGAIGQCSTILQTNPPGAVVSLNGNVLGKSPFVTQVPCGIAVKVGAQAPGFKPLDKEIIVKKAGSSITLKLEQ